MKAATTRPGRIPHNVHISIHAAREGGDAAVQQSDCKLAGFQSTPPVKAATRKTCHCSAHKLFQSTPPVKAATDYKAINDAANMISIHAAREGGDHIGWICGKLGRISIHAAREGGDGARNHCRGTYRISIHAAREGGDAVAVTLPAEISYFNPRRP